MPSQSDVRKRRLREANRPADGRRRGSRRDRQRRLVGLVAVIVVVMMVASLLVGLVSIL